MGGRGVTVLTSRDELLIEWGGQRRQPTLSRPRRTAEAEASFHVRGNVSFHQRDRRPGKEEDTGDHVRAARRKSLHVGEIDATPL